MRGRSRLLIIVGFLIIVVVVVVLVLPTILRPAGTPTPGAGVAPAQQTQTRVAVDATATAAVLPTTEPPVNIVVAVQNLNRGIRIPRDGVSVQPWPVAVVQNLPNAILAPSPDQYPDVEQYNRAIDELLEEVVVGKIARTDILRFQPILTTMLVEDLEQLGRVGPTRRRFCLRQRRYCVTDGPSDRSGLPSARRPGGRDRFAPVCRCGRGVPVNDSEPVCAPYHCGGRD
jgi:Flp pilus assembly protein CpaB